MGVLFVISNPQFLRFRSWCLSKDGMSSSLIRIDLYIRINSYISIVCIVKKAVRDILTYRELSVAERSTGSTKQSNREEHTYAPDSN